MCKSSDVIIRELREEDTERVKEIFAQGMSSLFPHFFRSMVFRSILGRITCLTVIIANFFFPSWYLTIACVTTLWFGTMFVYMQSRFRGYIQSSQDKDLSDISGVYLNKGNGTFLVATAGSQIIGMIGGEHHNDQTIEIRRVSVDLTFHGNGLGRRLVKELEAHAQKQGYQTVFLSCSSEQYAALALYRKQGFECVYQSPPSKMMGVSFLKFEKQLSPSGEQCVSTSGASCESISRLLSF